ncbi:MAG: hypothetical protein IPJ34_09020 [Myxococcales bacterium]|nr:hypothetical protein [Myxococcales bacterium]
MRARLAGSFVVVLGAACRREPDPSPRPDPGPAASSVVSHAPDAAGPVELRVVDGECHEVAEGSPPATKGKIVDCPLARTVKDKSGECTYRAGCSEAKCNPPPPVAVRCPKGL